MRNLVVVAGVVRRGGRILIARRAGADPLAGCWEFPGGKRKPGETPEAALRREWREEFGSEVTPLRRLGESVNAAGGRRIRLVFVEGRAATDVAALRVHDARAWVRLPELGRYVFAPADRPMVRHLARTGAVEPLPGIRPGPRGAAIPDRAGERQSGRTPLRRAWNPRSTRRRCGARVPAG